MFQEMQVGTGGNSGGGGGSTDVIYLFQNTGSRQATYYVNEENKGTITNNSNATQIDDEYITYYCESANNYPIIRFKKECTSFYDNVMQTQSANSTRRFYYATGKVIYIRFPS